MWHDILAYCCIILGGCIWGIGVAIYWSKKCRVIHDLFALIAYFVVSVILIMVGIDMCEENANMEEISVIDTYNPVVVEHLDLSDYKKS